MTEKEFAIEMARLRAFPIDPDNMRPDQWYQGREFWKTRYKRGAINTSKSAWYVGQKERRFPQGTRIGHEVFYYGAQIIAIREGLDWREVNMPAEVIL